MDFMYQCLLNVCIVIVRIPRTYNSFLDIILSCFGSYQSKDAALNAGSMLRECARYPTLVKYLLESSSFDLFFDYVELPNFDIASDSFSTLKELLTRHEAVVSEYLSAHYVKFFGLYERLLYSKNYVTRRLSLKCLFVSE
ncbi:hypothetical protein KP509_1Z320100 [Ceratopteris richardii]|nr:hypothetical protein KP509_1Z320100 [Ceratopteris richardii]